MSARSEAHEGDDPRNWWRFRSPVRFCGFRAVRSWDLRASTNKSTTNDLPRQAPGDERRAVGGTTDGHLGIARDPEKRLLPTVPGTWWRAICRGLRNRWHFLANRGTARHFCISQASRGGCVTRCDYAP